jgi:UDP-N-acetylmuramoyl-tripeptide--D-alanyl-D-alanine ligase
VNGRPRVLWTASEAAAAASAAAAGRRDWAATGVAIDSRAVAAGDLFVAIRGPRHDGHEFVIEALARGAAAAVVARRPQGLPGEAPLLLVGDTLAALEGLGRAARARARACVAGVTGSVGKTGTKEALRHALSGQGRVAASEGGLNNHWGLPLSLARMPEDADFGVFEMGMNHTGELEPLSRMARPHVAVVTTVDAVHSAHFASVEAIADAKAEIFAGLEADGAAVLNRDNPHFARLAARARARGIGRIYGFGAAADAEVRLVEAGSDGDGSLVRARALGRDIRYRVGVPGAHWVANSLAVLAAVAALGADVERAAAAMAGITVPKGRGQRHRVALPSGAFVVVDESYNASPVAVRAALSTLALAPTGAGGRRIAVLGDMLELGLETADRHRELADVLADRGIDLVFAAGASMLHMWHALPAAVRGGHAETSQKLAPLVAGAVKAGDVVTVKGSAGTRMGVVVEALLALDSSAAAGARAAAAGGR